MPDYDHAIERLWEMIVSLNKDQCDTIALVLDLRIDLKRTREEIVRLKAEMYDTRVAIDELRGEIR